MTSPKCPNCGEYTVGVREGIATRCNTCGHELNTPLDSIKAESVYVHAIKNEGGDWLLQIEARYTNPREFDSVIEAVKRGLETVFMQWETLHATQRPCAPPSGPIISNADAIVLYGTWGERTSEPHIGRALSRAYLFSLLDIAETFDD